MTVEHVQESPTFSPDSGFEPAPSFRLEIVRESRDEASKRDLIQAQTVP